MSFILPSATGYEISFSVVTFIPSPYPSPHRGEGNFKIIFYFDSTFDVERLPC